MVTAPATSAAATSAASASRQQTTGRPTIKGRGPGREEQDVDRAISCDQESVTGEGHDGHFDSAVASFDRYGTDNFGEMMGAILKPPGDVFSPARCSFRRCKGYFLNCVR